MAKFIAQNNEKKKRNVLILSVSLIFFALFFIACGFFLGNHLFDWILTLLISFNLFWSGINRFRKRNRDFFIEIDEEKIKWLVREIEERETRIYWSKVSWIKLERGNTITIYPGSGFKLTKFSEADREKILAQIQEVANMRQTRLINFSVMEPVVA